MDARVKKYYTVSAYKLNPMKNYTLQYKINGLQNISLKK
jgi:hypothetical protein